MLRDRRAKQKSSVQSTPSINSEYHLVDMPMPKPRIDKHRMIPIDRMLSSVEARVSPEHTQCMHTITSTNRESISRNASDSNSKIGKKKSNKSGLNTLLLHNAKYKNLHFILILLLLFCIFVIISLCSPDMIGIDHSFQEIYYPPTHHDNFIFVYGPMINTQYKLRELIRFTPKSQRTNQYILHDHFGSEIDHQDTVDENSDENNDEEELTVREFPVRIHHVKRGFYFDSSFNGMDNEQIVKYKDVVDADGDTDGIIDIQQEQASVNRSYTALGVQFDENYDVTVNGLLLRIDEDALLEFDKHGFGAAFRRETIPLQWIDFLYSKPKEFAKNMELEEELEEEKLDTMKKEKGTRSANKNETEVLQKKDIDDANSMMQREEVDIEIINEEIQLIDNNQNQENANNKLNVMNEENTKKYQLNVWTYIVPKEIMIQDEDAQFHRIMKQSYIDVVLAGCLDIGGTQFAQEFVQTTAGWTPFMVWNDDRGQSNIFEDEEQIITQYHHQKIDALLHKYVFGA
eukprot:550143_1